jgi:hypothetical protein
MRNFVIFFFSFLLLANLALQLAFTPAPPNSSQSASTPQPDPTPGINYLFSGTQLSSLPQQVSFTYQGLAADITGEIQLIRPYSGGPTGPSPDIAYPTHLKFYFNDFISISPSQSGWKPHLRIYPVNDYRSIYGADPLQQATASINNIIDRLQVILVDRPSTFEDDIPFLPPQHNAQIFKAQIKYLDFKNGSGIRFITQHALGGPISNQFIFYSFQGLTSDGQYYVALFYPVSTQILANMDNGSSFNTLADFQSHVQETTQRLNALSANNFTPNLRLLDEVTQSLQIVPTP